ncbi:MAG: flagellar basal body P-ring formation chaperone FlgA [Bacteroidota bacterium]
MAGANARYRRGLKKTLVLAAALVAMVTLMAPMFLDNCLVDVIAATAATATDTAAAAGGAGGADKACETGGACGPAAQTTERVRIEISSPAEVRRAVIRLGDIARIGGEAAGCAGDVAARLRDIEIGQAPLPGQERTLSLAIVRVRLRQAGFDPDDMVITSPTTIVVRTRAATVAADVIAAAVRNFIEAKMPWGKREAEVAVLLGTNEDVLVPEGDVSLEVEALPTTRFIGNTSVKVTVLVDGAPYRVFPVRLRVDVAKAVVVAARTIQRHETIASSDVRIETRDLARMPQDVAFDLAAVVGMRASHTIPAGRPVAGSSVEPLPVVRRGELVTIEAVLAGVVVASPGEALEDGCEGARIRVRNVASGTIIRAVVISSKVVRAI